MVAEQASVVLTPTSCQGFGAASNNLFEKVLGSRNTSRVALDNLLVCARASWYISRTFPPLGASCDGSPQTSRSSKK